MTWKTNHGISEGQKPLRKFYLVLGGSPVMLLAELVKWTAPNSSFYLTQLGMA